MMPTRPERPLVDVMAPVRPRPKLIGTSVEGRLIEAVTFGNPSAGALVLAGVHGDEPKSVYVARQLVGLLSNEPELGDRQCVVIVPLVNPDGYERRRRRNANRVDPNRNFPTKNWVESKSRSRFYGGSTPASEPEARAVMGLVARLQPQRILAIHSVSNRQFCNNYDGPALDLARAMSAANGYRVAASVGYPTPGSLGTWAGLERNIPTITLELPSHHSRQRCWRDNREALLGFIR